MSRLFLYDTSNFTDFPIGGQLTSIHNFLHYIADNHPDRMKDIILVGLTLDEEKVGRMQRVNLFGHKVKYYPVMLGEKDLNKTTKSIRVQYVKGLLKHVGKLAIRKHDVNYINTPEAYAALMVKCPWAQHVAFSHQNYFEMVKSFRFYQDKQWVLKGFDAYLKHMVKKMDLIFVLNKACEEEYQKHHGKTMRVVNSIVCPDDVSIGEASHHRMIFVGRLSLNKGIEPIIRVVLSMPEEYSLTIVGDGEEYNNLIHYARNERIRFTGAVTPDEVRKHLGASDILIMNSGFEGLPMTILEAQSLGLPVVTTDVGGIGEAVHYGDDAEKTDGTPDSIVEAIQRIESNYERYSLNALANAKRFDYREVNAPIYEALSQYWRE